MINGHTESVNVSSHCSCRWGTGITNAGKVSTIPQILPIPVFPGSRCTSEVGQLEDDSSWVVRLELPVAVLLGSR